MTSGSPPQETPVPAAGDLVPPTPPETVPPPPPPTPEFSVELSIPYPPRQSRLLLFGKWFAIIPLLFFLWVYGLAAGAVGLIGAVIVLLTGRYPRGMWDFYRRFLERQWKIQAYFPLLLTDSWTGKGIELRIDYPERQSRLLVLSRIVLAPLASILTSGTGLVLYLAVVLLWFTVLFTGRQPREFFDFTLRILQWQARVNVWTSNLRDERRLFRASKSVWVANVISLLALVALLGMGGVAVALSYSDVTRGQAVVRDFMVAGEEHDLTRAAALIEDPENDFRQVEEIFARRHLFDGYFRIRFESWQYNTNTGAATIELAGRVNYALPPDGELYALLVRVDEDWKIRTLRVTRTAK